MDGVTEGEEEQPEATPQEIEEDIIYLREDMLKAIAKIERGEEIRSR